LKGVTIEKKFSFLSEGGKEDLKVSLKKENRKIEVHIPPNNSLE